MTLEQEPIYNGRPITFWIDAQQDLGPGGKELIEAAFAAMDDRAVTWLMAQLDWPPSKLKSRWNRAVASVASDQSFEDAPDRREVAAIALLRLGQRAHRAIPSLETAAQQTSRLRDWRLRGAVLGALIRIRGDSLDTYLERMKSAPMVEWGTLACALGYQRTNACAAVPTLVEALTKQSSNVVTDSALIALGWIRCQPDLSVPVLTQYLTNKHSTERFRAAMALGQFGRAAKQSWSRLTNSLNDSDDVVKMMAACALVSIDDQEAIATGITCPFTHAHPLP